MRLLVPALLFSCSSPSEPEHPLERAATVTPVIGGSDAPDGYRFYVSLGGCGGSLIHPEWVLTAKHCVDIGAPAFVRVAYQNPSNPGQPAAVVAAYMHDLADIALLRLAQPQTSPTIAINRDNGIPASGEEVTVVGLGITDNPNPFGLQIVSMPTTDPAACTATFGWPDAFYHVCAGAPGRSACNGDSGGPVFTTRPGESFSQIALVSYGATSACVDGAGVHSRLSTFIEWIESFTGPLQTPAPPAPSTCEPARCGNYDASFDCQCDAECIEFGDCCGNIASCASPPPEPSCGGRCGTFEQGATCQCDGQCEAYGDCCGDYPTCFAPPAEASCADRCGQFDDKLACQCDIECIAFGDCCQNIEICPEF